MPKKSHKSRHRDQHGSKSRNHRKHKREHVSQNTLDVVQEVSKDKIKIDKNACGDYLDSIIHLVNDKPKKKKHEKENSSKPNKKSKDKNKEKNKDHLLQKDNIEKVKSAEKEKAVRHASLEKNESLLTKTKYLFRKEKSFNDAGAVQIVSDLKKDILANDNGTNKEIKHKHRSRKTKPHLEDKKERQNTKIEVLNTNVSEKIPEDQTLKEHASPNRKRKHDKSQKGKHKSNEKSSQPNKQVFGRVQEVIFCQMNQPTYQMKNDKDRSEVKDLYRRIKKDKKRDKDNDAIYFESNQNRSCSYGDSRKNKNINYDQGTVLESSAGRNEPLLKNDHKRNYQRTFPDNLKHGECFAEMQKHTSKMGHNNNGDQKEKKYNNEEQHPLAKVDSKILAKRRHRHKEKNEFTLGPYEKYFAFENKPNEKHYHKEHQNNLEYDQKHEKSQTKSDSHKSQEKDELTGASKNKGEQEEPKIKEDEIHKIVEGNLKNYFCKIENMIEKKLDNIIQGKKGVDKVEHKKDRDGSESRKRNHSKSREISSEKKIKEKKKKKLKRAEEHEYKTSTNEEIINEVLKRLKEEKCQRIEIEKRDLKLNINTEKNEVSVPQSNNKIFHDKKYNEKKPRSQERKNQGAVPKFADIKTTDKDHFISKNRQEAEKVPFAKITENKRLHDNLLHTSPEYSEDLRNHTAHKHNKHHEHTKGKRRHLCLENAEESRYPKNESFIETKPYLGNLQVEKDLLECIKKRPHQSPELRIPVKGLRGIPESISQYSKRQNRSPLTNAWPVRDDKLILSPNLKPYTSTSTSKSFAEHYTGRSLCSKHKDEVILRRDTRHLYSASDETMRHNKYHYERRRSSSPDRYNSMENTHNKLAGNNRVNRLPKDRSASPEENTRRINMNTIYNTKEIYQKTTSGKPTSSSERYTQRANLDRQNMPKDNLQEAPMRDQLVNLSKYRTSSPERHTERVNVDSQCNSEEHPKKTVRNKQLNIHRGKTSSSSEKYAQRVDSHYISKEYSQKAPIEQEVVNISKFRTNSSEIYSERLNLDNHYHSKELPQKATGKNELLNIPRGNSPERCTQRLHVDKQYKANEYSQKIPFRQELVNISKSGKSSSPERHPDKHSKDSQFNSNEVAQKATGENEQLNILRGKTSSSTEKYTQRVHVVSNKAPMTHEELHFLKGMANPSPQRHSTRSNVDSQYSQKEQVTNKRVIPHNTTQGSVQNSCRNYLYRSPPRQQDISAQSQDTFLEELFLPPENFRYSTNRQRLEAYHENDEFIVQGIEPPILECKEKMPKTKRSARKLECKTVSIVGIPPKANLIVNQTQTSGKSLQKPSGKTEHELVEKRKKSKRFKVYYKYVDDAQQSSDESSGARSIVSDSCKAVSEPSEGDIGMRGTTKEVIEAEVSQIIHPAPKKWNRVSTPRDSHLNNIIEEPSDMSSVSKNQDYFIPLRGANEFYCRVLTSSHSDYCIKIDKKPASSKISVRSKDPWDRKYVYYDDGHCRYYKLDTRSRSDFKLFSRLNGQYAIRSKSDVLVDGNMGKHNRCIENPFVRNREIKQQSTKRESAFSKVLKEKDFIMTCSKECQTMEFTELEEQNKVTQNQQKQFQEIYKTIDSLQDNISSHAPPKTIDAAVSSMSLSGGIVTNKIVKVATLEDQLVQASMDNPVQTVDVAIGSPKRSRQIQISRRGSPMRQVHDVAVGDDKVQIPPSPKATRSRLEKPQTKHLRSTALSPIRISVEADTQVYTCKSSAKKDLTSKAQRNKPIVQRKTMPITPTTSPDRTPTTKVTENKKQNSFGGTTKDNKPKTSARSRVISKERHQRNDSSEKHVPCVKIFRSQENSTNATGNSFNIKCSIKKQHVASPLDVMSKGKNTEKGSCTVLCQLENSDPVNKTHLKNVLNEDSKNNENYINSKTPEAPDSNPKRKTTLQLEAFKPVNHNCHKSDLKEDMKNKEQHMHSKGPQTFNYVKRNVPDKPSHSVSCNQDDSRHVTDNPSKIMLKNDHEKKQIPPKIPTNLTCFHHCVPKLQIPITEKKIINTNPLVMNAATDKVQMPAEVNVIVDTESSNTSSVSDAVNQVVIRSKSLVDLKSNICDLSISRSISDVCCIKTANVGDRLPTKEESLISNTMEKFTNVPHIRCLSGSKSHATSLDHYIGHKFTSRLFLTKDYKGAEISAYQKRKIYDQSIRKKMKKKFIISKANVGPQIFEVHFLSMMNQKNNRHTENDRRPTVSFNLGRVINNDMNRKECRSEPNSSASFNKSLDPSHTTANENVDSLKTKEQDLIFENFNVNIKNADVYVSSNEKSRTPKKAENRIILRSDDVRSTCYETGASKDNFSNQIRPQIDRDIHQEKLIDFCKKFFDINGHFNEDALQNSLCTCSKFSKNCRACGNFANLMDSLYSSFAKYRDSDTHFEESNYGVTKEQDTMVDEVEEKDELDLRSTKISTNNSPQPKLKVEEIFSARYNKVSSDSVQATAASAHNLNNLMDSLSLEIVEDADSHILSQPISCPVISSNYSSFEFLYEETSSNHEIVSREAVFANLTRPFDQTFNFDTRQYNVETPFFRTHDYVSPTGSIESGYASIKSRSCCTKSVTFFKKPNIAALFKPVSRKKSSTAELVGQGNFDKNVIYKKMAKNCQLYAKKVRQSSEMKLEDNSEEYQEFSLQFLLGKNCSVVLESKALSVKSIKSDKDIEDEVEEEEECCEVLSAASSSEEIFKSSTISYSETGCKLILSNECLNVESITYLGPEMFTSDRSIGLKNSMSGNFGSREKSAELFKEKSFFTLDSSLDPTNPFMSNSDSTTKTFFTSLIKIYEKEVEICNRLYNDDFFDEILLSAVKKHKSDEKKNKKRGFGRFFRKKMPAIQIHIEKDNFKQEINLEKKVSARLQTLASNARKGFTMLADAVKANENIDNEIKICGLLRLLERIENGDFQMMQNIEDINLEKEIQSQIKDAFISIHDICQKETKKFKRRVTEREISLIKSFVIKHRFGLLSKTDIVASYIGRGIIQTEDQLKAAVTFLMRSESHQVNIKEFEEYCKFSPQPLKIK